MSRWRTGLRVCRPLLLWLAAFLIAAGYTGHQHLLRETRLAATVSFMGSHRGSDAQVTLDGRPYKFGELVSLGRHQLSIRHPKAVIFHTNFFVWYGLLDLGGINLQRSTGMLAISAVPEAQRLTIRGPEFELTLTNSGGFTSTVPTDRYVLESSYPYWHGSGLVTVSTYETTTHQFAPKLGTVIITASHPDISYELFRGDRTRIDSGTLPASWVGLPEGGGYRLHAERKGDRQEIDVSVKEGVTNSVEVNFLYGAAIIESEPAGATVLRGGRAIGRTPLTLSELNVGAFEFLLRLDEYDTASGTIPIAANETKAFRTKLVSQHFTQAMKDARRYFADANFARAAESASEALKHKAGDEEAVNLQREGTTLGHLQRAEALATRGEYAKATEEANLALTTTPDHQRAKELVADFTSREQQRLEAIQKRETELAEQEKQRRERELAEQRAQQRSKELHEAFGLANRPYEDAAQFAEHELTTTNLVTVAGRVVSSALSGEQPNFSNVRLKWIYPHLFMIEARQRVGLGYRDCLIVGSQVRENETQIKFKVFEYDHPPDANLLGGLLTLSGGVKITSQNPRVEREKADKFQTRIKEGVGLVTGRIRSAVQ